MPSPADTIAAFYRAFGALDGDAMAGYYAENARFEDPVFTLAGRERVGGMWRMLTGAARASGRDVWRIDCSNITDASAHWEARYRFSRTGRMVHNVIDAAFEFDPAGRIVAHRDRFDFWRWSRQALGPAGWLLGWAPFFRAKVRAQANAGLERFLRG